MTHANIEKAAKLLGYAPKITFEEGMEKIISEINYWRNAPVWTEESIAEATSVWFKELKN